jgi:hypothetical protein
MTFFNSTPLAVARTRKTRVTRSLSVAVLAALGASMACGDIVGDILREP